MKWDNKTVGGKMFILWACFFCILQLGFIFTGNIFDYINIYSFIHFVYLYISYLTLNDKMSIKLNIAIFIVIFITSIIFMFGTLPRISL